MDGVGLGARHSLTAVAVGGGCGHRLRCCTSASTAGNSAAGSAPAATSGRVSTSAAGLAPAAGRSAAAVATCPCYLPLEKVGVGFVAPLWACFGVVVVRVPRPLSLVSRRLGCGDAGGRAVGRVRDGMVVSVVWVGDRAVS